MSLPGFSVVSGSIIDICLFKLGVYWNSLNSIGFSEYIVSNLKGTGFFVIFTSSPIKTPLLITTLSCPNETATGFTINGTSSDSTSGLAGYYFYVDGILQNSEINTSGTYNVTGMSANKTYSVYMEAVDKAGNKKKSTSITAKTNGELLKPRISRSQPV